MHVETVSGPNPWGSTRNVPGGHQCWFCKPDVYPPMPEWHTLCARCGDLIFVPGVDHLVDRMLVCAACDRLVELALEEGEAS